MATKLAQELTEGDLIDLTPAMEIYCGGADSMSEFEYAMVEEAKTRSRSVIVYTDQHNIEVPLDYEFEVV